MIDATTVGNRTPRLFAESLKAALGICISMPNQVWVTAQRLYSQSENRRRPAAQRCWFYCCCWMLMLLIHAVMTGARQQMMEANVMRRDDSNAVVSSPPVDPPPRRLNIPRSACHRGSWAGQRRQWRWATRVQKIDYVNSVRFDRPNSHDRQELNVTYTYMHICQFHICPVFWL